MEIKITPEMEKAIEERVVTSLKEGYIYGLTEKVKTAIDEKLVANGFVDSLAEKVAESMQISEEEIVAGLSESAKEYTLKVVNTILTETLVKIEEKVKSYGFIKIADKY